MSRPGSVRPSVAHLVHLRHLGYRQPVNSVARVQATLIRRLEAGCGCSLTRTDEQWVGLRSDVHELRQEVAALTQKLQVRQQGDHCICEAHFVPVWVPSMYNMNAAGSNTLHVRSKYV